MMLAIRDIYNHKDGWLQTYTEILKEKDNEIMRSILIIFKMIMSLLEADKINNTTKSFHLIMMLLLTKREELKLICTIASLNMNFEGTLNALEEMKESIGSGHYVMEADYLKYMYNLSNP